MSTKKVIGGSVAAIVILIIAQLAAQLAASALNLIKIPDGICNIIAGIFYVGLTYVILNLNYSRSNLQPKNCIMIRKNDPMQP